VSICGLIKEQFPLFFAKIDKIAYTYAVLIISTAPELLKLIFVVLDVSLTMGLTRRYKPEGFLHLYLQFLYIFHAISIRYTRLRMRQSICIPNFDEVPQSTAEIILLPVSDDGWPPYWHFTSNFHIHLQIMCNHPHVNHVAPACEISS